ncbi:MAG: hypothetical protein R8G33_03185 [Gammaproteobacteria bacterium]|nr:hypothetical protein [Gammaproteobacteria bacterium]
MNMRWELINRLEYQDGDTVNDHYSDAIERQLEKGSKVKLIFKMLDTDSKKVLTEKLWVEILLVQDDKYLGQLEDDPKIINNLVRGEIIDFEQRHIYESEYINPFDPSIKV